MKKILILTTALIFTLGLSFCSTETKDESFSKASDNEAFASLLSDLETLSDAFCSEAETRGAIVVEGGPQIPPMTPERVRFWDILKADGKGFVIGFLKGFIGSGGNFGAGGAAGLGRGAYASIKYWIKNSNEIPAPDSPGFVANASYLYAWDLSPETAGEAHNYIVESLFYQYGPTYIANIADSKLYDLICIECAKMGVDTTDLRTSSAKSDIIQSGNFIVSTVMNNTTAEAINILKAQYPYAADELDVVNTYFKTVDQIEYEFIPSYAQVFNEVVVASSIPVNSAKTIVGTTNVSVGSSYLWTSGFRK